jgi:EmrB/QacA subfamily drug resistance transporter
VLAAMGGVLGLILLDETVVGVALPTIRRELGMGLVASHWVISVYLLVFACLAAAAGKFADIVGFERLFLAGVAVFALASLGCGMAPDGALLIVGRTVQGVGAAMIFPTSIAIVTRAFPPESRGMAFGVYGAIGAFFLALGPLVGGFFTDVLSWRWIFLTAPPIAAAIAFVLVRNLADAVPVQHGARLDRSGLAALVVGLGLVVFGVMQGPEYGWGHAAIVGALIGGAAVLAVFGVVERRTRAPLIDLALYRSASFATANLLIFTGMYVQVSLVVFLALYFQNVLGLGPLTAGLALLPAGVTALVASFPVGQMTDRAGPRPVALATLAMTLVGLVWVAWAVGRQSYAGMVPGLVLCGTALNGLFVAPRRAALEAVPAAKQGETGGVLMTSQLLGSTFGVAVGSTVYGVTGRFEPLYLVAAALSAAMLAVAWRWMHAARGAGPAAPLAPG